MGKRLFEEDLVKYVSILSGFLIFIGIVKMDAYYGAFNIRITNFLEFSEIITSFLGDISLSLGLVTVLIVTSTLFNSDSNAYKNNEFYDRFNKETNRVKRFVAFVKYGKSLLLLYLSYNLIHICIDLIRRGYIDYTAIIEFDIAFAVLFLAIFFNAELDLKYLNRNYSKYKLDIYKSLIFLFVLYFFIGLFTTLEVSTVRNDNKYEGTEIHLNDSSTILSDKNQYYIGKTNSYIFMYNERSKKAIVYPMSEVRKIVLVKK